MTMKYLVLGPGAMAYFAILGCLSTIDLTEVKEISGSSAGSILGLLLCIGLTPTEILDISLSIDNVKIYNSMTIKSLISNYGMIPLDIIRNEVLLKLTYGKDPTFKELDKVLHISSFCVNTQQTVYFNKFTHPDMKVIDAVCMSIAVPFIISSVTYNNFLYIDGGTEEKVPVSPFVDKPKEDVFIIEIRPETDNVKPEINNIKDFFLCIFGMYLKNRYNDYNMKNRKVIRVSNSEMLKFNMDTNEKLNIYSRGFL